MHHLCRTQSQEVLRSDLPLPTTPEPGIRGGLESSEIRVRGLLGRALSVFTSVNFPGSLLDVSRDLDPVARLWRLGITNLR